MAHKKGVGSSDNGRDSKSKRLGVKLFGGQAAKAGNIIIRQRGTKYHAGDNVYMGKDFSLHAAIDGTISFQKRRLNRTFVNVLPFEEVEETVAPAETVKKAKPAKAEKTAPAKEEKKESKATSSAPVEEEVVATAKEEKPAPKKAKKDDLKLIEGVGPKIESLLKDAGFSTFAAVAAASYDDLKKVLDDAGTSFQMHDPTTWPRQAQLAHEGKMEELKEYQEHLQGGKEPEATESEE